MEIQDYPNYMIYEDGRVYNKNSNRFLKPSTNNRGYLTVCLSNNGKHKMMSIHRLIALYYIPNPENKSYVDHIDRNKQNNNIENLRWVTTRENSSNRTDQAEYIGVGKNGKKFQADTKIDGKNKHLGCYSTPEDASNAYKKTSFAVIRASSLIIFASLVAIRDTIELPFKVKSEYALKISALKVPA